MTTNRVDAVSLDALSKDHARLLTLLEAVGGTLKDARRNKADLCALTDELVEHVEAHFVHEEEGGYFRAALRRAPRLSDQAAILLEQHGKLSEQIQKLRMLARSGVETDGWWKQLEQQFEEFQAGLKQHEKCEDELLQDAFCIDIGTAD